MVRNTLKKVFLTIALISVSLMLAVIPVTMRIYYYDFGLESSYMHKEKNIIEKDFYKSKAFDYKVVENIVSLISNTVRDYNSEVEDYINSNTETNYEDYIDENGNTITKEIKNTPTKDYAIEALKNDIEYSKEDLSNNYPGVKYLAINKDSNITYSNTQYDTAEEYKKNVDGYVNIELVKKSHINGYYKKEINGQTYTSNNIKNITPLNMVSNKQIEVYISFPINIDEGSLMYTYINEYHDSIKYIEIFGTIGITSLVVFLLSTVLYKLTKGQAINKNGVFIKVIKNIPLEIWIFIIIFIGIFAAEFLISHYYGYSYWTEKICGFIGISIIMIILYLQLCIFKDYKNKLDFFKNTIIYKGYKAIKKFSVSILKASKKIPLIKHIVLLAIAITIMSIFVGFFVFVIGLRIIGMCIAVFMPILLLTFYIVKNLGYLSKIMDGTEKIKDGDLHYKIPLGGYNHFTNLADNINNIGEGLEKSIDKQLRSERLRSELITNVSHDLKTPLTSIINYIELIKKEDEIHPEHIKDYVNVLDSKSKRLKSLIEDLFEASKASSGNIELNMQNIDVIQLLSQSIGELEEKLNSSNLDLKINTPKEKVYIYADGRRMFRVFENLLSNIAKYSLPNTRVYIDLIEDNGNIKITMKNISAYELNFDASEITERFKRGDESRNTEGSGLGLAIAKDLVKLQYGSFNIDIDGDLFKVVLEFKKSVK